MYVMAWGTVYTSYNMGTSALRDIYARSPRAATTLLALLKSAQTLIASDHSTYILKDAHCDCGILL